MTLFGENSILWTEELNGKLFARLFFNLFFTFLRHIYGLQICDKNKICVDISDAFSATQRFNIREEVLRWINEVGIMN